MDDTPTVIAAAIVTIGSLLVAFFTRRSAKEDTVTTGFTNLTSSLQAQVNMQGVEIRQMQTTLSKQRRALREHEVWDWQMVSRLRQVSHEPVPDPPPLDVWE